jgi:hypothetical protein
MIAIIKVNTHFFLFLLILFFISLKVQNKMVLFMFYDPGTYLFLTFDISCHYTYLNISIDYTFIETT